VAYVSEFSLAAIFFAILSLARFATVLPLVLGGKVVEGKVVGRGSGTKVNLFDVAYLDENGAAQHAKIELQLDYTVGETLDLLVAGTKVRCVGRHKDQS